MVEKQIEHDLNSALGDCWKHTDKSSDAMITRVELSNDARQSVIYFTATQPKQALKQLQASTSLLRKRLSQSLTVRKIPTLIFKEDKGFINAVRVAELLQEIAQENPTS